MAQFSFEESRAFDAKLNEISLRKRREIVECPVCKAFIFSKHSQNPLRISCKRCEILQKPTSFCSNCLFPWEKSLQKCGNQACLQENSAEEFISKLCPRITIGNVKEIPLIRKCPVCHVFVEFNSKVKACKTVVCRCGSRFCFVCLRFSQGNQGESLCFEGENAGNRENLCVFREK